MMATIRREIDVQIPNLAGKIKEAREKDGRSVQALATSSGISLGYWYKLEQDEDRIISESILRRVEKTLGVDFGVEFDD